MKIEDLNLSDKERKYFDDALMARNNAFIKKHKIDYLDDLAIKTAVCRFLFSKYSGKDYPQYLAYTFHPEMFYTAAANGKSLKDTIDKNNQNKKLSQGFLTCFIGDPNKYFITRSPIQWGGKVPVDFSATKAKKYYDKYANKGRILDPCAG